MEKEKAFKEVSIREGGREGGMKAIDITCILCLCRD